MNGSEQVFHVHGKSCRLVTSTWRERERKKERIYSCVVFALYVQIGTNAENSKRNFSTNAYSIWLDIARWWLESLLRFRPSCMSCFHFERQEKKHNICFLGKFSISLHESTFSIVYFRLATDYSCCYISGLHCQLQRRWKTIASDFRHKNTTLNEPNEGEHMAWYSYILMQIPKKEKQCGTTKEAGVERDEKKHSKARQKLYPKRNSFTLHLTKRNSSRSFP